MPVRVPDTNEFSLIDVFNAVNDHAAPSGDLADCFAKSDNSYFDPTYDSDMYAPANSLKRFRNYGPTILPGEVIIPDAFFADIESLGIFNIENYPNANVKIFGASNHIYPSWIGTVLYESTDYFNNRWDGFYQGNIVPNGSMYVCLVEENGEVLANKQFSVMYWN